MNPIPGIVIFSAIETVILTVWLLLLRIGGGLPVSVQATAAVVLFVGLVLEHAVAYNVGKDRPPFSFPRA
jgi:uncharacterized transporter YbjL